MTNAFLVVVAVILALAIIAGSIYILVYFQHPEDRLVAWGPKVVVVLSLSLACFSVLMLPLDVANGNTDGGFPMAVLWQVVYILLAVLVVVVIPFAMFYYEGDEYDDEAPSQIGAAIKGTLITFFVFAVITVLMYLFLGIAEVPVIRIEGGLVTTGCRQQQGLVPSDDGPVLEQPSSCWNVTQVLPLNQFLIAQYNATIFPNGTVIFPNETVIANISVLNPFNNITMNFTTNIQLCCYEDTASNLYFPDANFTVKNEDRHKEHVRFRVSFVLFIISMIVFFGWILFIIFGGIGMVAMPFDCIASWKKRPIRISLEKYVTKKKEIGDQATQLIEKGKAIQERQKKGKERKRDRRNYNKFRQAVFMLEDEYERLQECYKRQGGKLILHFLLFIWGFISAGLTILWVLHIILYVITSPYPFTPFLNTMAIQLDDAFGLLGTATYGLFCFYLLVCCIKGNFKFGMRLFFLFPIHPMRVGNTLMSAFLFNCALIIICTFAVTQFCTTAFSDYAGNSAINSMFVLGVKNLHGLKYIFIGYVYVLLIFVFLAGIYFLIKPKDKPAIDQIKI